MHQFLQDARQKKNKFDYLANTYPPSKSTYPDGTDIEIYKFSSLKKLAKLTSQKEDKEHVTNFFWKNPTKFKTYTYKNKYNISNFKYSIDYKNELGLIKEIVKWPKVIEDAVCHHEPHRITFFLQSLASKFHSFWNYGKKDSSKRFIIDKNKDLTLSRLGLIYAVKIILNNGLNLLGVKPLEEMR